MASRNRRLTSGSYSSSSSNVMREFCILCLQERDIETGTMRYISGRPGRRLVVLIVGFCQRHRRGSGHRPSVLSRGFQLDIVRLITLKVFVSVVKLKKFCSYMTQCTTQCGITDFNLIKSLR
ncbi:hypothetical protein Ahy_A05g022963 isoform A [Arachis hypogaea]|uniref:Uncharacterized protein n=1 Tax=Arachis hypogaea TaxID=3818 RepID=A0A445D213_ARAHY|nr:hypothetical protein Ahy_A05g022963 isoform A [Arachis hypogaea]